MSATSVVPDICSVVTVLAVPRAPGCWHGGPGVLGTTKMLPKNRAKKAANGICVSLLSPLLGLAPLLWIAQRQQWWSSVSPAHPSASGAPLPWHHFYGVRRRESRFRSCPTLCPSQPDPYWFTAWGCAPLPSTLHSPGRLHMHQHRLQDWDSLRQCIPL